MGRTAKFDREAAIEVCMHSIWRNGYEASSVKSIAEELGITRSSFYNAFGSREALFLEVLNRYGKQTPDRVLESVSSNMSIKRLLTEFFFDVCKNRTEDKEARGCLAVNCVSELVGIDETLGPLLEGVVLNSLERFENLLNVAVSQKEIVDDGSIHKKALALQSLLIGLSVMSKVIRSRKELEAVVEQTLKGLGIFEQ